MRRPTRTLLLGAFAAAALAALGAGAWTVLAPRAAPLAEEALPLPPEPPRIADGPEAARCVAMLRNDPEAAHAFATGWAAAGGGEGAQHCQALAVLALGDPGAAAEQLERIAVRSPAGRAARAAVFAQAGQAWLMAGDPARAYGAATLALTLTPDDAELLIDRAVALGTLGRYAEATADLDEALAREPDRADALVFRAAAWRHLERAEAALRDVERALAVAPDNAEALLERGILRQLAGDTEGARMDWQRVIEVVPDSATADLAAQNLALNEAGPVSR
ncbi:tetratricopeptide repeat protein [Falsiroseomonas sp.]|uniref:tetratricopeptide repeat protein n=1 Tax=Falsiroseomonas sp. TaxID=2870721 RepID=UPI0035696151